MNDIVDCHILLSPAAYKHGHAATLATTRDYSVLVLKKKQVILENNIQNGAVWTIPGSACGAPPQTPTETRPMLAYRDKPAPAAPRFLWLTRSPAVFWRGGGKRLAQVDRARVARTLQLVDRHVCPGWYFVFCLVF